MRALDGPVEEGAASALVTLRIKVENREITEAEWFFIDDAKIRTVHTSMFYPGPELAVPNWPPFDGNWPLPAGIVPTAQ